jgi:hypothetical protein
MCFNLAAFSRRCLVAVLIIIIVILGLDINICWVLCALNQFLMLTNSKLSISSARSGCCTLTCSSCA